MRVKVKHSSLVWQFVRYATNSFITLETVEKSDLAMEFLQIEKF
jgi:hypothetical protein